MHDEDAIHPNQSLQKKLQHIYNLRRTKEGRVNFEDNGPYLTLLERLGNPHLRQPPIIHVAGTNGKGSVIAMLRAILQAEGYKVHSYTSPHLLHFNERINLAKNDDPSSFVLPPSKGGGVERLEASAFSRSQEGGCYITDEALEALLDELFEINGDNPVTFFEFTSALVFLAFSKNPADIVLLETGMGGRLDCTNVIPHPLITVITPVSYDHMEFLGDTLEKIAFEKAGIMKENVPCVLGPQSEAALPAFQGRAKELGCSLQINGRDYEAGRDIDQMTFAVKSGSSHHSPLTTHYPLPNLIGAHQIQNAGTALATLEMIKSKFPVSKDSIDYGLTHIKWRGRMEHKTGGKLVELLPEGWELWFDCGHNVAGANAIASVIKSWQRQDNLPLHIFLGMKENKDIIGVKHVLEPLAESLSEFKIGANLTRPIKKLAREAGHTTPARILVCGSSYNYF